jgi:hypothetical protein
MGSRLLPQQWLSYKGDRTRDAIGQHMGPNMLGEWLTVTAAEYDAGTNTTRLGLAYGALDVPAILAVEATTTIAVLPFVPGETPTPADFKQDR